MLACSQDPSPVKLNLGIGVYRTEVCVPNENSFDFIMHQNIYKVVNFKFYLQKNAAILHQVSLAPWVICGPFGKLNPTYFLNIFCPTKHDC